MPRISVFAIGFAHRLILENLWCALAISVCIKLAFSFYFIASQIPPLCSLLDLLLPLSFLLFSEKKAGRPWTSYTDLLKLDGCIPCSQRNAAGARQVVLPSSHADTADLPECRGKGVKQIPAADLCCTKKGQGS